MRFKKFVKLTDHTHACNNIARNGSCVNLQKLRKTREITNFWRIFGTLEPLCHSGQRPGQAACTDFRQRPVVVAEGPSSFQRPRSQSSLTQPLLKDSQHTFEGKFLIFWNKILGIFPARLKFINVFWEGHKFLRNLHRRFVLCSNCQIYDGDFAKFYGLLRIYEL